MTKYPTLKSQVMALPPEEMESRRALYSQSEWDNSFELGAWPHQLPPRDPSWRTWTVIAPRGCGKTVAGARWALDMFRTMEGAFVLCILHYPGQVPVISRVIKESLVAEKVSFNTRWEAGRNRTTLTMDTAGDYREICIIDEAHYLNEWGKHPYQFVWADDTTDAGAIVAQSGHRADKYVFTGPVKLYPDTVISRAGDPRA